MHKTSSPIFKRLSIKWEELLNWSAAPQVLIKIAVLLWATKHTAAHGQLWCSGSAYCNHSDRWLWYHHCETVLFQYISDYSLPKEHICFITLFLFILFSPLLNSSTSPCTWCTGQWLMFSQLWLCEYITAYLSQSRFTADFKREAAIFIFLFLCKY